MSDVQRAYMQGRASNYNPRTEKEKQEKKEYKKRLAALGPMDIGQIRSTINVPGVDANFAQTMRSQMVPALQAQQEAQRRQLMAAQARAGVRGGASAAQAGRMALQQGQQRAMAEQDIVGREQYMKMAAELAKEQMAQQELASRRAAASELYGAYKAGKR